MQGARTILGLEGLCLFFFFNVDHFKSLSSVSYNIASVLWLYVLVFQPWGMQDLNSLTRDQTHSPCMGRVKSYPLDCQESPWFYFLKPPMLLYCFWLNCLRQVTDSSLILTRGG